MLDKPKLKKYLNTALAKSSVGIETPYINRRDNAS